MLRTIIENDGKLVLGGFKTAGAYATGMGVTKNEATGVATIPSAETGVNLYVLDKERIPTGANAARVAIRIRQGYDFIDSVEEIIGTEVKA